jgi:glycosyltransferase involved in cell wall biosynthesis
MIYFNVGHTGLNEPALPQWIARNKLRAIYLIHDLIPLTHPAYCRPGEAAKHELRMLNVLKSARGVIGNSRDTLRELQEFARSRRLGMPGSVAAWISGHRSQSRPKSRPIERPYFVVVGTIEARKNHLMLLRLWERLVRKGDENVPLLVIIGQRGWEAEEATQKLDDLGELGGHVREIGSCDDEALAGWIAGSRAMLMPSFAEGFGLPVIEALQLGTPVIASDLPVFREIVGDIPTYLDPDDETGWEAAVKAFVKDGPERARQLSEIRSYCAPTWESHFARVEKWLATL